MGNEIVQGIGYMLENGYLYEHSGNYGSKPNHPVSNEKSADVSWATSKQK